MKICIFLEKYFFPEIYFPFLYNFLNDLSNLYNLFIYIPDIDIVRIKNCNPDISEYFQDMKLKYYNFISIKNFDVLLLFSEYDTNMSFDRRSLVIKDLTFKETFLILSHNMVIKNIRGYNCNLFFCNYTDNIFSLYKSNEIDKFKEKYKISNSKEFVSIILNKDEFNELNIDNYNDYNLLSLKNNNFSNSIRIDEIDFIYMISFSEYIITNLDYYNYLNNLFNINVKLFDKDSFLIKKKSNKINIYEGLDNIAKVKFIKRSVI